MNRQAILAVLAAGMVLAMPGCGRQETGSAPPPPPPAADTSAVPDDAVERYCRVCYVDGGHKHGGYLPERLNATYEGRTYAFCSDDCRKKFDEHPEKYALRPEDGSGAKDGHEGHGH